MPKNSWLFIALAVVVLAAWFSWHKPTQVPSTMALFAASFPNAQNQPQSLNQWHGKVMVINFWASWCPPCREEMPALDALQQKYTSKNVQFVGISAEDVAKLQEFSKEVQVSYPLLAADIDAMPLAEDLGNDKSILPYTVVVNKQGKIAKTMFGMVDISELETILAPLI